MFKLHKQSESQLDSRHNDVRNLGFHEYPLDDELVFLILATWAILKFELMLKEALILESPFVALVLLLVVWSSSVWAFEAANWKRTWLGYKSYLCGRKSDERDTRGRV